MKFLKKLAAAAVLISGAALSGTSEAGSYIAGTYGSMFGKKDASLNYNIINGAAFNTDLSSGGRQSLTLDRDNKNMTGLALGFSEGESGNAFSEFTYRYADSTDAKAANSMKTKSYLFGLAYGVYGDLGTDFGLRPFAKLGAGVRHTSSTGTLGGVTFADMKRNNAFAEGHGGLEYNLKGVMLRASVGYIWQHGRNFGNSASITSGTGTTAVTIDDIKMDNKGNFIVEFGVGINPQTFGSQS